MSNVLEKAGRDWGTSATIRGRKHDRSYCLSAWGRPTPYAAIKEPRDSGRAGFCSSRTPLVTNIGRRGERKAAEVADHCFFNPALPPSWFGSGLQTISHSKDMHSPFPPIFQAIAQLEQKSVTVVTPTGANWTDIAVDEENVCV
ncbi:unnamed protein product, partial [Phaeothamnion confervicola]